MSEGSAPDPAEDVKALIGRRLGNYRLTELLSRGGMGVVFRGVQELLDRPVAVKVIGLAEAAPSGAEARLFKEARATARLGHPNIVQVYDAGRAGYLAYIVMELVPGRSLGAWLRQLRRLSAREAVAVALGAARGLAAAHAAGIIHRDIKPDNLIVGAGGHTKVVDFGLTKFSGEAGEVTRAGMILGTPSYMSPEACEGKDVDDRSDLYSLGATLFASLAGAPPFTAKTMPGVLLAHVTRPPPRVRSVAPDAPQALDDLVDCLLAKSPAARPPSAAALAKVLEALARTLGGGPLERFAVEVGRSPEGAGEATEAERTAQLEGTPVPTVVMAREPLRPAAPPLDDEAALEPAELLLRARVYLARGAHRQAESDLRAVLRRGPAHPEARVTLACLLVKLDRPDEALGEIEQALAQGFRDVGRLKESEALRELRRHPRFQEALAAAARGGGS